jgi:predicted esterase
MARGLLVLFFALTSAPLVASTEPEAEPRRTGYFPEVPVLQATRLDWKFAGAGLAPAGSRLPMAYASTEQRYQLYVPEEYTPERAWPVVVFLSPGDTPLGWEPWEKCCKDRGLFFCSAYRAGSGRSALVRTRVVLDVLDDVRRRYRIDPERTYLIGFSAGGRLACELAFALPEYAGGVAVLGGKPSLPRLAYLRYLVQDRLSLALVAGARDRRRDENEKYFFPLYQDLGMRCKLWVVPEQGHALPVPEVLADVYAWLEEDLPRRRLQARKYPGLATSPREVLTDRERAKSVLETARQELLDSIRLRRGEALLEGVVERWGRTEAAEKAEEELADLRDDPARAITLRTQAREEQGTLLQAQARGLERLGRKAQARQTWLRLSGLEGNSVAGRQARVRATELTEALLSTPFLGLALSRLGNRVQSVVARGPADRAGLRRGDHLVRVGEQAVASLADLKQALEGLKPGQTVMVEIQREGKAYTLPLQIGAVLSSSEDDKVTR